MPRRGQRAKAGDPVAARIPGFKLTAHPLAEGRPGPRSPGTRPETAGTRTNRQPPHRQHGVAAAFGSRTAGHSKQRCRQPGAFHPAAGHPAVGAAGASGCPGPGRPGPELWGIELAYLWGQQGGCPARPHRPHPNSQQPHRQRKRCRVIWLSDGGPRVPTAPPPGALTNHWLTSGRKQPQRVRPTRPAAAASRASASPPARSSPAARRTASAGRLQQCTGGEGSGHQSSGRPQAARAAARRPARCESGWP